MANVHNVTGNRVFVPPQRQPARQQQAQNNTAPPPQQTQQAPRTRGGIPQPQNTQPGKVDLFA